MDLSRCSSLVLKTKSVFLPFPAFFFILKKKIIEFWYSSTDWKSFPKPLRALAEPHKPVWKDAIVYRPKKTPNPHKSCDPLQNHKKLSAAPHSVAFHHAKRPRWEQQCGLAARSGWVPVGDLAGFSRQSAHSVAFPLVGALTPAALNALEEVRVPLSLWAFLPLVCCASRGTSFEDGHLMSSQFAARSWTFRTLSNF